MRSCTHSPKPAHLPWVLPWRFFSDNLAGYQAWLEEETVARQFMITDDLDGSAAAQTISYTIDGQDYEIDLSEDNIQRFHEALEPFVSNSRQVQRQAPSRRSRGDGRRRGSGSGRDDIP